MLLKLRWGIVIGAVGVACYAACSGGSSSVGTPADAGEHESGSTTPPHDAGPTTSDDGAISSSDGGSGTDPFATGSWASAVHSLAHCNLLMATDPATTPGPLKWSECSSGRSGCQTMHADWTAAPGQKFLVQRPEPVRIANGTPYLSYTRYFPGGGSWTALMHVVQPLNGAPVLAVGASETGPSADRCAANAQMGDYGLSFVALSNTASNYEIEWSSWATPQTFDFVDLNPSTLPLGNAYDVGPASMSFGPATLFSFASKTAQNVIGAPAGAAFDLPLMVPAARCRGLRSIARTATRSCGSKATLPT